MFFGIGDRALPGGAVSSLPRPGSPLRKNVLVALKVDTDHAVGITGRYTSKTDSLSLDGVYRLDENSLVHASYGVTEEKVLRLGLETGFDFAGRKNVVDLTYAPPSDAAGVKLTVRHGKTKLVGAYSFPNFSSAQLQRHRSYYELDTRLSDVEALKMSFDQTSKAAKIKLARKLDDKNRFEAEYNYVNPTRKFVGVTVKHLISPVHMLSLSANYGTRKYHVEWDIKTANGPWTFGSSFGFASPPHKGDWSVKRRFEF